MWNGKKEKRIISNEKKDNGSKIVITWRSQILEQVEEIKWGIESRYWESELWKRFDFDEKREIGVFG